MLSALLASPLAGAVMQAIVIAIAVAVVGRRLQSWKERQLAKEIRRSPLVNVGDAFLYVYRDGRQIGQMGYVADITPEGEVVLDVVEGGSNGGRLVFSATQFMENINCVWKR